MERVCHSNFSELVSKEQAEVELVKMVEEREAVASAAKSAI